MKSVGILHPVIFLLLFLLEILTDPVLLHTFFDIGIFYGLHRAVGYAGHAMGTVALPLRSPIHHSDFV